jgi:hypothetical protein
MYRRHGLSFEFLLILFGLILLLGFAIVFHSYDYISLFVSFFYIPVSLGSLFQRMASIIEYTKEYVGLSPTHVLVCW